MKIDIKATWGDITLEFKSIYKGLAQGLAEYRTQNIKALTAMKGVYIYVADNGECIYIGKAKEFNGRVREHNKELGVEELAEAMRTTERMKWIDVFEPHKDRVIELFFVPLEAETERVFVEMSLQEMFSSQFKHAASRHIANKKVHIF
jgi:hypothetical protein